MAIATMTAIGLGLGAVGAFAGAKATSKAAKTAANTQQNVATQNNALAQQIYGSNQQALSPFMARGNVAGDAYNALLGLGGQAPQQAGPQSYYTGPNPASMTPPGGFNPMMGDYLGDGPGGGQRFYGQQPQATMPPQTGFGGQTAGQAANSAFDTYRNSTGYQFRLGEGANALNSLYAGRGTLQSGAAAKALQEYGQNFASNEFGNYMNLLGNQQGVGLAGASALAGVGQNYVNTVSANNQNAGDAVANAALIKGQNNPFANTLGLLGGGLFGYGR